MRSQTTRMTLAELIGPAGMISDGDWIESKDQDPEGSVRLVQLADIGEGIFIDKSQRFLTEQRAQALRCTYLQKGDLLIARMPDPIGRACIFPGDSRPSVTAVDICIVRPDQTLVDTNWLKHVFNSRTIRREIEKGATGTTRSRIATGKLKGLSFNLPPLEEQKRIAAILDKADSLRRKRAQAIALADDFLRATFLEMFGDPVTNPKGFTRRLMKEFYANESDGTKCGPFGSALKKDEYKQSGIPVWNMDNISLTGDFFDDPKLWVAEGKFNDLASYSVKNGDVIISRAGTVGKMGVVHTKHEKSLLSTNLIRVRFNSKLKPEFFVALMTYCKGRVGRLKVGPDGAFTHMNVGIIDSIEFPYPPIALQENFLTIVNRIKRQISKNVVFQEKLDEMHFAISQIAFSESGNE